MKFLKKSCIERGVDILKKSCIISIKIVDGQRDEENNNTACRKVGRSSDVILSKRNRKINGGLYRRSGEVDKSGHPLRGRGQRSPARGGRLVGSLDSPLMINLTKHTSDDVILGEGYEGRQFTIEDMHPADREYLMKLHDFNQRMPVMSEIRRRASAMADLAVRYGVKYAWVGGSGYLVSVLDGILRRRGITPVFSWSRRSYMSVIENGVARLEMYRKHSGWIVMDDSDDSSCGDAEGIEDVEDWEKDIENPHVAGRESERSSGESGEVEDDE